MACGAIFVPGPWLRDHIDPIAGEISRLPADFSGAADLGEHVHGGRGAGDHGAAVYLGGLHGCFSGGAADAARGRLALGATKWEMVRMAVLPFGVSGVIGAIILGLGRALGETIAVAMVIGNRPEISASLFMPSSTLASVIANEFVEATSDLNLAALVELGLVLLVLGLILNIGARMLVYQCDPAPFREGYLMLDASGATEARPLSPAQKQVHGGPDHRRHGARVDTAVFGARVSVEQRLRQPQLGLFHQDAGTGRPDRRRHGQCDRRDFLAGWDCLPDGCADRRGVGRLHGREPGRLRSPRWCALPPT